MSNKIKLIIADDNESRVEALSRHMAANEYIEICGIATDGDMACRLVMDAEPDLLLLNMNLSHIDGLGVLDFIRKNIQTKLKTVCISVNFSEYVIQSALKLGATYCITLPVDIPLLAQRIVDVANVEGAQFNHEASQKNSNVLSGDVDEMVTTVLLTIGIPAHIKGYSYLRRAITLTVSEPEMVDKITRKLYPAISEEFRTMPNNVERAIRHAMDIAWSKGRIKNVNELFGIDIIQGNDRLTNGEFIALAGDRIRSAVSKSK